MVDMWEVLEPAVARVWPKVPDSLSEAERERLEAEVLVALRALETARGGAPSAGTEGADGADPVEEAAQAVAAAFEAYPPLGDLLVAAFDALVDGQERFGPDAPPPSWGTALRSLLVPVLYATDRAPAGGNGTSAAYGGDRGQLSYGEALVNVPDDHRIGAVEKPRWWRLRFRTNPARDTQLGDVSPLTAAGFAERARGHHPPQDGETPRSALVFVHGYNVSFADAAVRAAQIAYDLNFTGLPMLYSWPSKASVTDYAADGNAARRAVPYFQEFLRHVLTDTGVDELHVVAHSMGNRVVVDALADLDTTALPEGAGRLGQVVFTAPDVDAEVFRQLVPRIINQARGCTLYVSANDRALAASRLLAEHPRAGQAGPGVVVAPGLDTVDVSELDTGLTGHSYPGDHRSVLSDLYGLLRHGHRPSQRYGLARVPHPDGAYWAFQP
ncbi:alpha/beta hydrolase [Kitasatospora sp. MY 5-36]|uniref:alpha/beta hydrolase n=1 Tax=Kitasatospora sp. MY 5-36 TaxID=1678027 RepID=UPI0006718136|nr:alpha/beta hydrolase [Kitasatospora sp. MY 5-36]